jgi:transposase-like protein
MPITTIKLLAIEYGVCRTTMREWIKPFKKDVDKLATNKKSRIFNCLQSALIRERLGEP